MFSLAKIKNKKSFFLPIIILFALNAECYGMEKTVQEVIASLGSKDNPVHIVSSDGRTPPQEESLYYKAAWTILPIAAGAALNFIINKYNEDPELTTINKEEKKIELKLKEHPDYPAITLLHQKNAAENKANQNKQAYLSLKVQEAQLLEHHQENMSKFLQCTEHGSSEKERNYCADMYELHSTLCKNWSSNK